MGRGTKFNRSQASDAGVLSGTTVGTYPSGTTLSLGGIEADGALTVAGVTSSATIYTSGNVACDDVECDGIDTGAGTAFKINGGDVLWTGATMTITHGFTTLNALTANYGGSGVTAVGIVIVEPTAVVGGVSFAVRGNGVTPTVMTGGGSSVYWIAIGE